MIRNWRWLRASSVTLGYAEQSSEHDGSCTSVHTQVVAVFQRASLVRPQLRTGVYSCGLVPALGNLESQS